jgi:D-alanine-D-alanine ligase
MSQKKTIAVLFGGQSGEHEVSLVSAQAVMAGLDPTKYNILPIGISKAGRWIAGAEALPAMLAAADHKRLPGGMEQAATNAETENAPGREQLAVTAAQFSILDPQFPIDIVFPALHGPMGEDGTVQGLLELAGIPYVGSGVAASSVGMDKALMKAAFAAAGLPILPWLLVRRHEWQNDAQRVYTQIEQQLTYPLFVKPANMGSSVGVNKAHDRAGLERAIAAAAHYDRRIIVERGVTAREIEVSVLGNDEPQASVPGEVIPSNEWYDYAAKYLDDQSEIVIPAPIPADLVAQVQALAIRAFVAIDGAGLARVDFLLDKESGALWLNEINTMPGFTPISMYAKMWAASGMEYNELLDQLVELALERHRQKNREL